MSSTEDLQPPTRLATNPVRTAAVIIYSTFALLVLTIPQSLTNWLRDMDESPLQQVCLYVADTVQSASHRLGFDVAYREARAAFHALTGKEDE